MKFLNYSIFALLLCTINSNIVKSSEIINIPNTGSDIQYYSKEMSLYNKKVDNNSNSSLATNFTTQSNEEVKHSKSNFTNKILKVADTLLLVSDSSDSEIDCSKNIKKLNNSTKGNNNSLLNNYIDNVNKYNYLQENGISTLLGTIGNKILYVGDKVMNIIDWLGDGLFEFDSDSEDNSSDKE